MEKVRNQKKKIWTKSSKIDKVASSLDFVPIDTDLFFFFFLILIICQWCELQKFKVNSKIQGKK